MVPLRVQGSVLLRQAHRAGAVAGRYGRLLVGEEDAAVLYGVRVLLDAVGEIMERVGVGHGQKTRLNEASDQPKRTILARFEFANNISNGAKMYAKD